MPNSLPVMYCQYREEWLFDGLGHLLWAGRGTPRQPCLPNPACSLEAPITSQPCLNQWGHQHLGRLNLWEKNPWHLLPAVPNPKFCRQTKPRHRWSWPLEEWDVHSPLAVLRKRFSRSCHGKVRLGMHNARWHSHAVGKLHHPLPSYKEFRFFSPSFKNHV